MKTKPSSDDAIRPVASDPGVGGLLADPLGADPHRDEIDPDSGEPIADPAPPRHHHDWSPNKQPGAMKSDGKEFTDA